MLFTDPVTLANEVVRLEALDLQHADDLAAAAEGLEYAWYTSAPAPRPEAVADEIRWRRAAWDAGTVHPFAVVRADTDRAVGMTTFCNIDQANRHVEIGYTWLSPSVQRTAVNSAAKLLLLGHAFDACDAIAVELRTAWHNRQSRAAIERLGAKQDGVLRSHRLGPDGSLRDTVVYSIVASEWPAVRLGLTERLRRR